MGNGEQVSESLTVSGDGVSVTKQMADEDEFPVPTVRFELTNDREEPAEVSVIDDVPEGFPKDAIGFHPEYGEQYWDCDENHAVFERELDAGKTIETLYAIRIDDSSRAGEFMTEPTLGEVAPIGDLETDVDAAADDEEGAEQDDETTSAEEADEADEGSGTNGASLDIDIEPELEGADDSADSPETAEPPTLELDVEDGDTVATAAGTDRGSAQEGAPGVGSADATNGTGQVPGSTDDLVEVDVTLPPEMNGSGPETGGVVDRLVEELQREDVDPEKRERLREELDLGVPTEFETRVEQLQSRVENVAAYTDALEEFLDEEGRAQELLDDYESQVTALRDDVATLRQHTRSNAGGIAALNENLESVADHVDDVEERLADVATHADTIENSLGATDDHLDDVEGDLRTAEERIDGNAEDIEALDEAAVDLNDDLEAVEDRVTDAEGEVDDLHAAADELGDDLEAVEGRVSTAEDDVDELDTTTDANARAVGSVESDVDELRDHLADTDDDVADVEAHVERVEDDLDSVEDRVSTTEADVDDLEGHVQDVDDGLDELVEWRDQLGEMFK